MDQSGNYFTISGLAKELDVKKSHIRFCEESGLIPPRASKLKRGVYNRYDRERLKFVFYFVLLGYSKEQVIDLIGIPDADLDENEQLSQGIEYGLNQLKRLEKLKEELSFTKQTRIINEIEMLREYIKKIKSIKSGAHEEPSIKPSIKSRKQAKINHKPVLPTTEDAEKKKTQYPVKVISFFFAGFALILLIGGYFYYQAGQKKTKALKLAHKKPVHSEKILLPQAAEPANQSDNTQDMVPEAQKIPESDSPAQWGIESVRSTDASLDAAKRNGQIWSEPNTGLLKNGTYEENQLDAIGAAKEKDPSQISTEQSEKIMADAAREPGLVKVTETKGTPSLNGSEKDMEQIASAKDINQQKSELNRLNLFLAEYCQAYTNKDFDKFLAFFTSDATENNKPFHDMLPELRENMTSMESLTYRIELTSYSKQTASDNLVIRGRFFTRYQLQKGVWEEKNGRIVMELIKNGESFLVKQLNNSN